MLSYTSSKLLTKGLPLLAPRALYSFASINDPKNQWKVETPIDTNKTSYVISRNLGLSKFLTRTYNTTGLAISGALGVGYMASMVPAIMANPMVPLFVGGILSIGSFFAVNRMKTNLIQEVKDNNMMLRTENPIARLGVYSLGVMALGFSTAPLFAMANAISPTILPSAIALAAGIFGGASLAAYSMPKDKMIGYGRILGGSLIGLIAMQLVGLGSLYFMGPNAFSGLLFSAQNYFGIALFTGFVAYDTHLAIKSYEMGNPDHLGVSIQFLLDFWNLMVNIISMLSRRD